MLYYTSFLEQLSLYSEQEDVEINIVQFTATILIASLMILKTEQYITHT